MATAIKSIPILDSKQSEYFDKKLQTNQNKLNPIDFSDKLEFASNILAEAKL